MLRPRVLCMVDLSCVPEALRVLRQVAAVDCREPDRQLLIDILDGYDAFWGTFKASGAIDDSGDATYHLWNYFVLDITGKHGSMLIETVITHGDAKTAYGTFHIFAADGAYSDLVGVTGAYSERMPNYKPVWVYPEGPYPTWHLYQTFDGSLPEE